MNYALQTNFENKPKELQTHFVYAGYHYHHWNEDRLRSFFLRGMKKYKIKSVMMTIISMCRRELITKETMENYCNGGEYQKDSVNDDLESLFEDLRLGKKPHPDAETYFFPKLTQEELELVARRDRCYLETFFVTDPDVQEADMKLSESDSKFVRGECCRRTFKIENSSLRNISNCCSLQ